MAWANEEIAGLLREYAELTQITGGDVFRARNYEKAARSVRGWADDISRFDVKALRAIPGVGASIAAKIAEFRDTGSITALEELRAKIPAGVLELTRVPGLGPKRALQLSRDLGVASVDDLAAAIKAGRLDGLAGFGAKSAERIASGIEVYRQGRERVLLDVALRTATAMVAALTPLSQRCAYAGSLRRWRETIGDIDILAAADDSAPLMAAFAAQPEVTDVVASGPTKTTVRTVSGLTADLRVVPLDAWGAALQYFTGSAAHNVAIRQIAIRQKLKLSEYGLFDAGKGEGRWVGRSSCRGPRRRSTRGSAWPGCPRPCERTAGRSKRRHRGRYPASFGKMILKGTCIRTPTSPTGWPAWRPWWRRRGTRATRTTPSPTTRRT